MSVNTSGQDCLYSIQPVPVPVVTSPSTSSCGGSPKARDASVSQFPTPTTMSGGDYSGHNSRGENRRGRPRSESLTTLMIEGSTSPSSIKCKFCNRVFPREKSLAAHLRTHTGERPYQCDYPGCTRSFTQSGQLKTHQRLHTGERPFICSQPNCEMRFTHANRHCPVHVHSQLKRDDNFVVTMTPEQNEEVLRWLEKYRAEREDRGTTPTRKTPQRNHHLNGDGGGVGGSSSLSRSASKENHPNQPTAQHRSQENRSVTGGIENVALKRTASNDENECPVTPSTPNNSYKSRKGLMVELDMNAGLGYSPVAPLKMKPQPKVIQWQEPLSQEEDSDFEGDSPENGYRSQHNVNHVNGLTQLCPQNRTSPAKRTNKLSQQQCSSYYPKKKWLREACLDDLAKPLDACTAHAQPLLGSPQKLQIKSMNLMRPTVLMLASKDNAVHPLHAPSPERASVAVTTNGSAAMLNKEIKRVPEDNNRKWLGAMALMQLATENGSPSADAVPVIDELLSKDPNIRPNSVRPPSGERQGAEVILLNHARHFQSLPEYTHL